MHSETRRTEGRNHTIFLAHSPCTWPTYVSVPYPLNKLYHLCKLYKCLCFLKLSGKNLGNKYSALTWSTTVPYDLKSFHDHGTSNVRIVRDMVPGDIFLQKCKILLSPRIPPPCAPLKGKFFLVPDFIIKIANEWLGGALIGMWVPPLWVPVLSGNKKGWGQEVPLRNHTGPPQKASFNQIPSDPVSIPISLDFCREEPRRCWWNFSFSWIWKEEATSPAFPVAFLFGISQTGLEF